jgi:hypothetical protein
MFGETTTMNATANGISGLTNLSSQTGTLGTFFGMAILLGLIVGGLVASNSWNTKGWLYKLVRWLISNIGENVLYGIISTTFIGGVYYIGSELSKFGDANPRFLYDVCFLFGEVVAAILLLAIIGFATKPIWEFVYSFATGTGSCVKSKKKG